MFSTIWAVHDGLGAAARVSQLSQRARVISVAELAILVVLGAVAATASAFLRLRLGIAGHSIIRVIFPMAMGLALVPRRGSASVMGVSAVMTAALFQACHVAAIGTGAMTSLVLTGFLIDVALLGARSGWSIYLRLTAAGFVANLAAFLIRAGDKIFFGPGLSGKPINFWASKAIMTYSACGIVAGLISALVWFRFGAGKTTRPSRNVRATARSDKCAQKNNKSTTSSTTHGGPGVPS